MKLEHIEILKKMKNEGVKKDLAEKVFLEYQKEEKDYWFNKTEQRITSLYIETMRDIISSRKKENFIHKTNSTLEIDYEVGHIFNMNFYLNQKKESNFFHPALIVHKNDDYLYICLGTSSIDTRKAFHYKSKTKLDKKLFLIKSYESKFETVSLNSDTVFMLNNIQAVNIERLKRSQIIGSVKNNESIIKSIEEYYKNFF